MLGSANPPLDVKALRAAFPALARRSGNGPVVFADAPGGTQVPRSVIDAVAGYLERSNANTGGAFDTSRETDALIEEARTAAADLVGADPDEVVFGPNMTTLAFSLSRSLAATLRPGDEVVVTVLDHDANVAPWLEIAAERNAAIRWVDIREDDCTMDVERLEGALSERTAVVAFTVASNAVGTITPAEDVVGMVRRLAPRAVVVADGVHAAQHRLLDLHGLGVDVLFCSAYKFFGPHIGLMAGRRELLASWRPYKVRPADDSIPWRWETGTLDHEGLAGLVAAVEYLAALGRRVDVRANAGRARPDRRADLARAFDAIAAAESDLAARFLRGLRKIPGLTLFGIADPSRTAERTPTFALRLAGRSPREVAEALGRRGIFVWDGNYFALAIMERLGLEASGGAVRIGFCHYNLPSEADRVVEELAALAR